jgi:murein peptide amidase A
VQRLGRNQGGYHGDRIDSAAVVAGMRRDAARCGFVEEVVDADGIELVFLKRVGAGGPRLYLSAGIHGDEPAALLALAELLRRDAWPLGAELWICPCLNPTGCARTTRENAAGVDQNRDYLHGRSPEVRAHIAWLERQPRFDLHLCLHEDWESHGFYLYEVNPDGLPTASETVIESVREVCPVDTGAIVDGRESALPGILRPPLDPASRPEWPEAFWILQNKTRLGYTLEGPSDWPMEIRVNGLVRAVEVILAGIPRAS